jgi:hypothetical protein
MIQTLVFIGAPLLLLAWLAGLPSVWRGRPKLSMGAAGAGMILGLICAFSGMLGSRQSNIWTGEAGNGDGFGLIGLFLMGAGLAGIAFLLLIVAAVAASLRVGKPNQEVPE